MVVFDQQQALLLIGLQTYNVQMLEIQVRDLQQEVNVLREQIAILTARIQLAEEIAKTSSATQAD